MRAPRLPRRLFSSAFALAALCASALAQAEQGTVVLSSGEVITGDIQQVVQGEYLIVQLPNGQVKAIAWAQIGTFKVGGSVSVGGGAPPPAATPAPPPPPVYAPAPPPPAVVYAPPPPPPAYGPPPPPPPPPRPPFEPAWMLGARLGQITPSGNLVGKEADGTNVPLSDYASTGWSIEGDIGLHFSPSWTFYGFWEYGQLGKGRNTASPDTPTTNAIGIGLNANTSPHGPIGFLVDIAVGYRWFNFSQAGQLDQSGAVAAWDQVLLGGAMPLRLGGGVAITPARKVRIDVLGQFALGAFSRMSGAGCPNGCAIESQDQGTNVFAGLAAGVRWDL